MDKLKQFKVGDVVDIRVPCKTRPGRRLYLHKAHITTISECGRYAVVKGRRAWAKKEEKIQVYTKDLR